MRVSVLYIHRSYSVSVLQERAYGFSAKTTEGKTHSLLEIAKFWLMYGNKIF